MKNKILFIAPLPPEFNGQTKVSKAVHDKLLEDKSMQVVVIDTIKKSLKNGVDSFGRILDVVKILFKIWQNSKNNNKIYLSLSESNAGNVKDLFTYLICYKSLNKLVIHMLGGAGMKVILSKNNFIRKLNVHFQSKVKAVIVESEKNFNMFAKHVQKEKIFILPNFVDDYLYTEVSNIEKKYEDLSKINLLYLSNLLPGKGYLELTHAFIGLEDKIKSSFNLTFVGGFEDENSKNEFLELIKNQNSIKYLGKFIDGVEKKVLYENTHVFCLPTYYPYEGLPISILEAYASGLVVITTDHSGIPYIFKHQENGFLVEKKSILSIKHTLNTLLLDKNILMPIGLNNFKSAQKKYSMKIFQNNVFNIISSGE